MSQQSATRHSFIPEVGANTVRQHYIRGATFAAAIAIACAAFASPASGAAEPPTTQESSPALPEEQQSIEVVEDRTETSRTYMLQDGTFETHTYTVPVNYQDGQGNWVPINNNLVATDRPGYTAENAANDFDVLVPEDAGATPVRLQSDGDWISFLAAGAEGPPTVRGTEFTIDGLVANADLEYEAMSTGVKETIVLPAPPAGSPEWTFDLDLSAGLTPRRLADGGIEFIDDAGDVAFTTPAAYMFDSSYTEEGYSSTVDMDISRTSDGWTMTVKPDSDWLRDPNRDYPVMIDPTITTDPPVKDCWISAQSPDESNCGSNSPYLRVGTSNGDARRSLLKFDISSIPLDATVSDAQAQLYLDETQTTSVRMADYVVRRVTQGWTSEATWNAHDGVNRWATPGGDFLARSDLETSLNGSASGYKSFDATPMVTAWFEGTAKNSGLLLKQKLEDTDSVLYFHSAQSGAIQHLPKLVVTYTLSGEGTIVDFEVSGIDEARAASVGNVVENRDGFQILIDGQTGEELARVPLPGTVVPDGVHRGNCGKSWLFMRDGTPDDNDFEFRTGFEVNSLAIDFLWHVSFDGPGGFGSTFHDEGPLLPTARWGTGWKSEFSGANGLHVGEVVRGIAFIWDGRICNSTGPGASAFAS
jgi:Disaggregatase related repeat